MQEVVVVAVGPDVTGTHSESSNLSTPQSPLNLLLYEEDNVKSQDDLEMK